jgi:hypothetical protein
MAPRSRPAKKQATPPHAQSPKKPETVASVTQAFASHVAGTIVTVKQGSSITTTSEQLDLFQGIIGLARTKEAKLAATRVGAVLAGGTVVMDQSAAGIVTTRGTVSMEKSGAILLCGNEVRAENSSAVFLLANKVRGPVKTLFGTKEALMVGAAAGLVAGLLFGVGKLLSGSKGRKEG